MNSMGEIIAARRKDLGMTQKELAEKMNVTDKAVSKWERNLSCPDVGSIPRLAEVLGLSVAELMDSQLAETVQPKQWQVILDLVLKVVPLAMGVGVVTLSALGQLEVQSGLSMLGIGLFCMALRTMQE